MVALQEGLGALTVLQLLPSAVVTAHLALALALVITVSALTQVLLADASTMAAPRWWLLLGSLSVLAVSAQSLLGARMATSWASQRCLKPVLPVSGCTGIGWPPHRRRFRCCCSSLRRC